MASHFAPTPAELALVNQIFTQADTQKLGILTGDVAVRIFGGAKLAPSVLGEIWNVADEDNNGFLTRKGVAIAVRLMGWAQKGEKISQALLSKSGPLATIEGVHAPLIPQGTGMSIPKSPPPGLPVLKQQDKARFARLFHSSGPVSGLLSGDKARDLFVKSKISVDKLSQIWSLADTQERGSLDLTDFTIAMYLIQVTMSGQLSFIPTFLPPGLYEQAGGAAVAAHATGSSGHPVSPVKSSSFPAAVQQQPVQANFTGQSGLAPTLLSRRAAPAAQVPAVPPFPGIGSQATGFWDVTPAEKAAADRFFDNLDSQKRGYIEGDVAVPFMLQSKLPEDVLAQVWDLADINNDGRLTRDGFAVAMHLIQGKLSGKEIPATLPPTLVPPSMRSNGPTPSFAAPPPPRPTETVYDLLWDDSPPTSTVTAQPQHNVLQPHATGTVLPTVFPPPATRAPQALDDPFAPATRNSSAFHKDLLGDDDETHAPPPMADRSAEIGNLQNQVTSTNKSLQNAKAERETLEAKLASQAAQLSALEIQLASAKASFDTETALLNTLKERDVNQKAEIQKVREELIRSESDLSAIRVEKAEIEGSFLRDKEEVRELNRRMAEVTTQIGATKQEVEKAKKDAKQQKGLLAIARKQLATKESEKTKADEELHEAQEDLVNVVEERKEVEAEVEAGNTLASSQSLSDAERSNSVDLLFAAAHPLPATPDPSGSGPLSPSGGKSNNPFEKWVSSGASTPRPQSPFSTGSIPPPPGLSPPSTVVTTLDDPFGISQALELMPQPPSEVAPGNDTAGVSPTAPKLNTTLGEFAEVVSSPADELFSTPPNSVTPMNHGGDATPQVPSLDSAAVHFPALDDIAPAKGDGKENETDLSTDLHELDVNETDSDTDSDEEEKHGRTSQDQESHPPAVPAPKNESALPPAPAPTPFDDVFGAANDTSGAASASMPEATPPTDSVSPAQDGSAAFDAFGVPLVKPTGSPEDTHDSGFTIINTPVVSKDSSGLSSFDEAFGKSSSTGPAQTTSSFSFDSAFEDNFDFGAPSGPGTGLPSAISSDAAPADGSTATAPNVMTTAHDAQAIFSPSNSGPPAPVKADAVQAPVSFDDAFSNPWPKMGAPQPAKTVQSGPASISFEEAFAFEEAFGGLGSSQAPKLDDPHTSRGAKTAQPVPGSISFEEAFGGLESSQALKLDDPHTSRGSNPVFPPHIDTEKRYSTSPPTSSRGPTSPRVVSIRSGSPQPRAMSPPPRVASPKTQRPSTASSAKDVAHEKPAPPPRHSKLSIRLFGRKKKPDSMPPVPGPQAGQHLVQVEELGAATPAADDDVVPVRQLTAMGFGREQAVAALEAYDYDVQRALNNLLGAQ